MTQSAETATAGQPAFRLSRLLTVARVSRGFVLSAGVWILLVLNFNAIDLPAGDPQVQFEFVKRLFGDPSSATGYHFGLAFVEAPFYAVGKVLAAAGLDAVAGYPVEEASVALGLGLLTVVAWPLLAPVLRGLSVRHGGPAILAAGLGTPLFYYSSLLPGKNHMLDALLFTGAIYLAYRYFSADVPDRWLPFALGALFAFACSVRYFNGAEAAALVLLLVYWRRFRHAAEIVATASSAGLALFLIPGSLDVPIFSGSNASRVDHVIAFAPLNPLRMLFTDHRGYFVWSPVAVLAVLGLVWLFRRRPEHRRFLTAIVAMAIALMSAYSFVWFWDGGVSFGQRFFTPLFPLVAIGLAGLLTVAPRLAGAAAAATVAWSLYLCFNFATINGAQYHSTTPEGAVGIALAPARADISPGAYAWGVWSKSNFLQPVFPWPLERARAAADRPPPPPPPR